MLVTTIAESTPEAEEPRRALGFFFFVNRCACTQPHTHVTFMSYSLCQSVTHTSLKPPSLTEQDVSQLHSYTLTHLQLSTFTVCHTPTWIALPHSTKWAAGPFWCLCTMRMWCTPCVVTTWQRCVFCVCLCAFLCEYVTVCQCFVVPMYDEDVVPPAWRLLGKGVFFVLFVCSSCLLLLVVLFADLLTSLNNLS